jgi:hypothetical protein
MQTFRSGSDARSDGYGNHIEEGGGEATEGTVAFGIHSKAVYWEKGSWGSGWRKCMVPLLINV